MATSIAAMSAASYVPMVKRFFELGLAPADTSFSTNMAFVTGSESVCADMLLSVIKYGLNGLGLPRILVLTTVNTLSQETYDILCERSGLTSDKDVRVFINSKKSRKLDLSPGFKVLITNHYSIDELITRDDSVSTEIFTL